MSFRDDIDRLVNRFIVLVAIGLIVGLFVMSVAWAGGS